MTTKYLISVPVLGPQAAALRHIMGGLASIVGLPPLYEKLEPHVTLVPPVSTVSRDALGNLIYDAVKGIAPTEVFVYGVAEFGGEHIVLPVSERHDLAVLWVRLNEGLAEMMGARHEVRENRLHISLAADIPSAIFPAAWAKAKDLHFEPMKIPVQNVELHKKSDRTSRWELVKQYPLDS